MKTDSYKTIKEPVEGFYKEKGSKFISFAYPVDSQEEVKHFLDQIKKEHFSARHHCFAFRLGISGEKYKVYDDGEPGHTAGDPIYNQIRSYGLTNVLIIVVRYFGGTKLGKSGLINAYKTAATDALNVAKIIVITVQQTLKVSFKYEGMNEIMRQVKALNLTIIDQNYADTCEIKLSVKISDTDLLVSALKNISAVQDVEMLSG